MVTSPQDHWMIKGSGFEIGGEKERQDEVLTNQKSFLEKSGSFLKGSEKVSSRELITMFAGRERPWRGGWWVGETVSRCAVGL